jgi:hypothetical protein
MPGFDADPGEAAAVRPHGGDALAGGLNVCPGAESDPEEIRLDEAGGFDVVNVLEE